jgi:hypothetical protein
VDSIEYPLIKPDELAGEAWAAINRQDADEALRVWRRLREDFPDYPDGHIWPIQVLWQSGQYDKAEAMAREAFARFPGHVELAVQYAWIATSEERWDEAAQRWAAVRHCAPERIEGYAWGIRAAWQSGRTDESEALAAEGLRRFPENAELLIEHVWAAVARHDWAEAATRLAKARVKDLPLVKERLGAIEERIRALAAVRPEAPDLPVSPTVLPPVVGSDDEISTSALMLSFENIGEHCDFGSVQRHFGVEPLGLLRFAWSRLDSLRAALEDRFDVVGSVEDTAFEGYGDETILRMKKYELIFHTFVYRMAQEPLGKREAFYEQQRRRLLFLKDKLIADLEDPQKIWIYSTNERISDQDAARLFGALRAYGRNSLLYVRPAQSDRPEGRVETLEEGLYAGYFPGLTSFIDGDQPPFELWRELCLRTYRLATAGSPGNGFLKSLL